MLERLFKKVISNSESPGFRGVEKNLEPKKHANSSQENSSNDSIQEPLSVKDYRLGLRIAIQEFKAAKSKETSSAIDLDSNSIKALKDLISEELMDGYKDILIELSTKSKVSKEHPQREFIDIDNEQIAQRIETWINSLTANIQESNPYLNDEQINEIQGNAWLNYHAHIDLTNAQSLEKDIKEFYQNSQVDPSDPQSLKKLNQQLIEDLSKRYPLTKNEIKCLIELTKLQNNPKQVSLVDVCKTIAKIFHKYKMHEQGTDIALAMASRLVATSINSYSPTLFSSITEGESKEIAQYAGLWFLSGFTASTIFNRTNLIDEKINGELANKINERISKSLFFRDFQLSQSQSFGDIYTSATRGKNAILGLYSSFTRDFLPDLSYLGLSSAFLFNIHPYLGLLSLANMPVFFALARKNNKYSAEIQQQEQQTGAKVTQRTSSVINSLETVKTSANAGNIQSDLVNDMNKLDKLAEKRKRGFINLALFQQISFRINAALSFGAGFLLQANNMVSPGTTATTTIYGLDSQGTMQGLVDAFCRDYPLYINDIETMEEKLGAIENFDMPDGPKEAARKSVSELENLDISIRNLSFNGIIKDLDLDIKQGEFVSIIGESGKGKSTLLRLLSGLYQPSRGSIEIGETHLDGLKKYGAESIYSKMSYSNQNPQIFEDKTLKENLLLWSDAEVEEDKLKDVLKDLNLAHLIPELDNKARSTFSGGEKVRIGLARTLLKDAQIIILDEPTTGLDTRRTEREIIDIIKNLHTKYPDKTIICVTHSENLEEVSDRVINLDELMENPTQRILRKVRASTGHRL